ncbi:MAG: [protein-PII] uridylyltransferase [Propionibacteriales bacterium]|nr:[protein-PII] uridylyltransferase [Propionibacteriales bacterium]
MKTLAERRQRRSDDSDARLRELLTKAVPDPSGTALVAVGGYGRRELSPFSDLDVVLVHTGAVQNIAEIAGRIWYPLWDSGTRLDHAVRTLDDMRKVASSDLRGALGMLDARHVAGDPAITVQLRSTVLADWRAAARRRIPAVREDWQARAGRAGQLAYAAVPDIKESQGGLRDGVMLRALVSTWLVDVPHAEAERCRNQMLAIRDTLHEVTGKPGDRLLPEVLPGLAEHLGYDDPDAFQRHVRGLGRRMNHLTTLTWHRLDGVLETPRRGPRRRRPDLEWLSPGLARSGNEVVLESTAKPADAPLLLLRAAALAAERRLMLAPASARRLAQEGARVPEPWPREARDLLVRLLGAGPGLVAVWETLEEVGAVETLLPEWAGVRMLASTSAVHRFTVDRHLIEACVHASGLLQRVSRPDLLLVAVLLHDIGKSAPGDHSVAGAETATGIARRWGFTEPDAAMIGRLVRHHLLLPHTAIRRDPDDPATVALVAERVGGIGVLELLAAMTECDARATSPAAWTAWRRGLVEGLVRRTRDALEAVPVSEAEPSWPGRDVGHCWVDAESSAEGTTLLVGAPDRVGLLASVAAAIALSGLQVRSARAGSRGGTGWSRWRLSDEYVDPARFRQRLLGVLGGTVDVEARLSPPNDREPPHVSLHPEASARATVIEVRAADWRGLVYAVCSAMAGLGLEVRSAYLETLGPRAVDVFYVADPGTGPLPAARGEGAAAAVRRALS